MSKENKALAQNTQTAMAETPRAVPMAALQAQLNNNWAGVSQEDRLRFSVAVCQALNIPTPLNPFKFIDMSRAKDGSKVAFYAPSEAAQLLADRNHISLEIKNKYLEKETNIYVVEVQATTGGRKLDNYAAMFLGGLMGEARANAMMKCATKAMRRTTFATVGLSVMDEDELASEQRQTPQTLPTAPVIVSNSTSEPDPRVDQETAEFKTQLRGRLLGFQGKFHGKATAAQEWVLQESGKKWDALTADDCVELLAALDREKAPEPKPPTKAPIDPTAGMPKPKQTSIYDTELPAREPDDDDLEDAR